MSVFRVAWKTTLFLILVLLYFAASIVVRILFRSEEKRRHFYSHTVSIAATICLKLGGFKLKVINPPPKDKKFLHVMNHMGMVDILSLASVREGLFITSYEMKSMPLLGQMTEMGGCLFVERRNRSNISNEILEIREALVQGFNVILYPEAMATPGDKIYPFKKSLMTAAAGTDVHILPCVFNFKKINGEPMSHKWREHVSWYGDNSFVKSFAMLLSLKSVEAEIEFLEPIEVHSENDRREVATKAQAMVESKYIPIPYPPQI